MSSPNESVLRLSDCHISNIKTILNKYKLTLHFVPDETKIPGSYWGDSEAGIISNSVFARMDTPIHSLFHETCHYICMDSERREKLDTDAEGDYDEENGVCYLQIVLSNELPEMGIERMLQDMDSWGYTFRLGSAKKWFQQDAVDARDWLMKNHLLLEGDIASYQLRL